MEPLNCLAEVNRTEQRCTVWAATQDPDAVRATAARVAGRADGERRRPSHPAGRRLRPADHPRRGGRSGGAVGQDRAAHPGAVVARGRHPPRPLPRGLPAPAGGRAGRQRYARRLVPPPGQPLHRRRGQRQWPGGQHRHRRRRRQPVRHPEPAGGMVQRRAAGTGGHLALGRLLVQHLRGRKFPGRAGSRRRPGSTGPAPAAAGGSAPVAGLPGSGRPARRVGTAARRRAAPWGIAASACFGSFAAQVAEVSLDPAGARACTRSGSPPTAGWW